MYQPGSNGEMGEFVHPFSFNTNAPGSYNYAVANTNPGGKEANATIWQGIDNWFTGNLDYQRTLRALAEEQEFSALEASKARDWQKMMSDTAHQREANDLLLAGYNPALTLNAGGANAYSASSASSPGARSFNSGKGFDAMMNLIMGLVSLGVNNARKVDSLDKTLDMADKKLNANLIQNDARLNALQAHWDAQEDYYGKRIKLGEARNSLALSDSYDRMNMEHNRFKANYARGFRV